MSEVIATSLFSRPQTDRHTYKSEPWPGLRCAILRQGNGRSFPSEPSALALAQDRVGIGEARQVANEALREVGVGLRFWPVGLVGRVWLWSACVWSRRLMSGVIQEVDQLLLSYLLFVLLKR